MVTWRLAKKLDPVLADAKQTLASVRNQSDLVGPLLAIAVASLVVIAAALVTLAVRGEH